ncbi:hypothetical protein GALL_256840 [mine drainage metagenome]|uniref:Uncharacterized protein n=1 Tax=mine drainage metagenome TaxID=410659 RepID=A0A1J5R8P3_9ZZZZ
MPLKRHEKDAIRFLLNHLLYGMFGGVLFGGLLLYLDIGHLRTMALRSDDGILPIVLLFFGLIVTFGGIGMAAGVMGQAEDRN